MADKINCERNYLKVNRLGNWRKEKHSKLNTHPQNREEIISKKVKETICLNSFIRKFYGLSRIFENDFYQIRERKQKDGRPPRAYFLPSYFPNEVLLMNFKVFRKEKLFLHQTPLFFNSKVSLFFFAKK